MSDRGSAALLREIAPSPAHREAVVARDVLERALLDVQRIGARLDRSVVTDALTSATDAIGVLAASGLEEEHHLSKLEAAKSAVDLAHAALRSQSHEELDRIAAELTPVLSALDACTGPTVDAQMAFHAAAARDRSARLVQPTLRAPFRASQGAAILHWLGDEPLAPRVRLEVPEEDLLVVDDEEDEEELPQPAPKAAPLPIDAPECEGQRGELAMLRRLSRDLMEEIGVLGGLRAPRPARLFSAGFRGFEARMLAALDALVALGQPAMSVGGGELRLDVLSELLSYAGTAFVPDPVRSFALAFVLSCVEGEDRVRAAVLALRQAHPTTYPSFRDALMLGSSASIAPAMRRLCEDAPAPLVRLALDVLAARREADMGTLLPLLEHPDPGVRIRAVRCLGVSVQRGAETSILGQVIEEEPDTRIVAEAARSLCRRGSMRGLDVARRLLLRSREEEGALHSDARLDLLELLGIAGQASDVGLLQASLTYRPREALSLGWHGHPSLVEPLLAALERDSSVPGKSLFCVGIARALARVTGFCAEKRIAGADMEPGRSLVDLSGQPTTNASAWRAAWLKQRDQFSAPLRYRFGRPYTPLASLDELMAEGTEEHVRELLVLELDAALAGTSGIELRGYGARVSAEVERLRVLFEERSNKGDAISPGEWASSRWARAGA